MKFITLKKESKKNIETSSSKEKGGERYTIYHNNRCSKSREACSILQEKGIDFETVEYLKTPLNQKQIKELLAMLGITAEALVRKSEPIYKEKFANKKLTNTQWIKALAENPVLIERPIIVKGDKAVIGRPIENAIEFLK
jgi:arsenate reductase